jgi:tRNA (mo5U34)-methyltransferase
MSTRSIRLRGFSVDVTVPERVIARFRGRRSEEDPEQPGRVLFLDPPPRIDPRSRDLKSALAFRDIAEEKGQEHAESMGLTGSDELTDLIRSTSWYHTIDLPGGITTPGQFDHRELLPRYGLPKDLTGKRALDVATFNGYWAFELEKRGAQVTAIDLDDPREWDYPRPVRAVVDSMGEQGDIGAGFRIAHRALNSAVERVKCSVYELDPEKVGMFDLVHSGDLLLHLRNPLAALEAMRSVTSGQLVMSDVIDMTVGWGTYGPAVQYMGGWDDLLWWVPSLDALAQMVVDAGFRDVSLNCVYNIAKTYETAGSWRASLTASV